jgi:hypothetical protein
MRIRRTAALLAVATSLLAAGATTASAKTTLTIQRVQDPDNPVLLDCLLTVKGDPVKPFQPGGYVDITVFGEDTFSDDRLGGAYRFFNDPHFAISFWMPGGCPALNEDWGEDEIYVTMGIYDLHRKFVEGLRSNTVSGSF